MSSTLLPIVAAVRHLSLRRLGASLLQAVGVLWLVVEITAFFAQPFSTAAQGYWWVFLLAGSVIGIYRAVPRLHVAASVPGTDCKISVRVCDITALRDVALIVGSNTTFDTSIDDGTISGASIQGVVTRRLADSIELLDREICHSLEGTSGTPIPDGEKPYGKQLRYDVGTVATVQLKGVRLYFLALATLNAHKVAHATRQDVQDSLPRLWEYIRTHGGLDGLACPILGSGFSRLDATREELLREIIRSFIPAALAWIPTVDHWANEWSHRSSLQYPAGR